MIRLRQMEKDATQKLNEVLEDQVEPGSAEASSVAEVEPEPSQPIEEVHLRDQRDLDIAETAHVPEGHPPWQVHREYPSVGSGGMSLLLQCDGTGSA